MAPLNPTTGQVILQAAQGLSRTLELQQQLVAQQQAREEAHQQEILNLKGKAEARELKLELDKLKIESEQLGLREQKARATKLEAEASLIQQHGPVETERLLAAARAAGRGGKGSVNFSARVEAAVSNGAQKAFVSDLKGAGSLGTDLAAKVNLRQGEDGRTFLESGEKELGEIDVDHHLAQLGVENPADLSLLGETRAGLLKQLNNLSDLTKFRGMADNQRLEQQLDVRKKIKVTEAMMEWSLMNQLNRSTDDLLELSGDKDLLNLRQAAAAEPALNRQVVVADMPTTMSNQAKNLFFNQINDPEPNLRDIAAAIRRGYPKTPEGAIDFDAPENEALMRTIQRIHGDQALKELANLLNR